MTMSKNEGIEKDGNDKDKQYQKREDMIKVANPHEIF